MPQPDQAIATLATYRVTTTALRAQLLGFVRELWLSLGTYRNAQMAEFTGTFGPLLQGAEQQMVALTTGYLHQLQTAAVGVPIDPFAVDTSRVTGAATRQGTDPAEVYERPFHQVWREISAGAAPETAIGHGLKAAEKAAVTDLQRTKVLTANEALSADREVIGFRRKLEGSHSCGLCIVASTQLYHKAKLLPIHPGCDCDVVPVYGESDEEAAQVLNLQLLQDVHTAIEDTFGASSSAAREIPGQWADGKPIRYQDVLIVHEHGELGQVLGVRGQHFTGPSDL